MNVVVFIKVAAKNPLSVSPDTQKHFTFIKQAAIIPSLLV